MFNEIAKELWKTKVSKGFKKSDWSKPETVASKLMLIVSELSEAMEEIRAQDLEKFRMELIDVLIRTLETLHEHGADIDLLFAVKTRENRRREYLHGKKVAL